jgi:hypothetical protein
VLAFAGLAALPALLLPGAAPAERGSGLLDDGDAVARRERG